MSTPDTRDVRPSPSLQDRPSSGRRAFVGMLAADVALPLAVFYGLRAAGVNQWLALVLGSVTPAVRLAVTALRARRVELMGLFTLSLLAIGTAIGLVIADARLLVARESYLTGVVGLWILATLLARRPMVFEATVRFMPEAAARQWQRDWETQPRFRRALRVMTAAWGLAFLVDAAVRVVMAYTIPVDLVPLLSTVLLALMLVAVVQAGKAYGRRHLTPPDAPAPRS